MLYKRIDYDIKQGKKNIQWHNYIYPVMLVYNNKNVHSSIGKTPDQARKDDDKEEDETWLKMKENAKTNRTYERLEVGDKVRLKRKRQQGEKERVHMFTTVVYPVEEIKYVHNIPLFVVNKKEWLRSDLLKV